MKKKFLSLMMAAAVVATTSVSAFAKDITGDDVDASNQAKEYKTEVEITGDVADDEGNFKPGTISVTVPTATAFSVAQDGTFNTASLDVTNNGNQEVEVFASEFIDVNGDVGIKLIKKSDLSSNPRTAVSLSISGNRDTAYLGKKSTVGTGIFSDEAQTQEKATGYKISEILPRSTNTITLNGEAGTNDGDVDDPVKDTFTLKLMIKKKTN